MSWMLDYPALLKMCLFLLCPEPELLCAPKSWELLSGFDLHTDDLNNTLLCLHGSANKITFCNHTKIMLDCMAMHTVFSLLFGNQSVFLYVLYAMAEDLREICLSYFSLP